MPTVGVNAWGWEPWGLPFAAGMALHVMDSSPRRYWSKDKQLTEPPREPWQTQAAYERRFPDNPFIQNAEEADTLVAFHRLARAMPCHDRPMQYALMSGAYERADGGIVQPHALWAMEKGDT